MASPGPKLSSLCSHLGRGKPRGILIPYFALLGSEMRKITFSFRSLYVGNKTPELRSFIYTNLFYFRF